MATNRAKNSSLNTNSCNIKHLQNSQIRRRAPLETFRKFSEGVSLCFPQTSCGNQPTDPSGLVMTLRGSRNFPVAVRLDVVREAESAFCRGAAPPSLQRET